MEARDMASVISKSLDYIVRRGLLPAEHRDIVEAALLARERKASSALGNSVAVPHAYLNAIAHQLIVFVRLARPINLGAPDGIPTRFVFVLLGPEGATVEHLDTLATIARLVSDDQFRYEAGAARTQQDLLAALDRFFERTAPAPTKVSVEAPQGLVFTSQLFGGLKDDIRRRWTHYASDFRDGLSAKSLGSTLFLFFACLAPAVTFGGIMGAATDGNIGVVEMLVASAACGVIYALFSGQPMIILGGVGPLLVFTAILYQFCVDLQLAFLPTYAWVGLWTALLLLILAATDASYLMRFFTRFTDEIFSVLMAIIFIYEAVRAIIAIFRKSFAEDAISRDAAFLSLILAIGTFYIAISLSQFRRSKYLLPWMREFLADFGPMIALAAMTTVSWLLRGEVMTASLQAPDTLRTTIDRAWLVDLLAVPTWTIFAAIGPALLATVLVYLTQNITARLINSPDNKLRKGPAYHLDLTVVGALIGVCSLFGLPWLVAATVRSLAHVRGLATVEEVISRDGATRERVTHVHENRVTGLVIHLLIALSLLLLPAFKYVPMSVLYGIFLFMGVVSLAGNQFVERMTLWVMDPALYPSTHYIRQAPLRVIHKFTFLQLVCLALLCAITFSRVAPLQLTFPMFIAVLVPVRFLAGRVFDEAHLQSLDADATPQEEETHWSA
jgi:mannitol/fructose-specific phosphotransferase system IIA component (Ntr-type)